MKPPFVLIVEVFLYCQVVSVIFIRKHPIVDKGLRLDDFQSFEYGMFDRVGIGRGFLGILSFGIFQLVSQIIFFVSWLFPISMSMHEIFPS